MRVLVVEDDPKIASFVTAGLKQAGFAVDHAAEGEEGLHLALTESYDAAVVDLMLPKLDGLSVIEALWWRGWRVSGVAYAPAPAGSHRFPPIHYRHRYAHGTCAGGGHR